MEPWKAQLAFDRLVVTGGGSGIGRDTALAAASTGAAVYVLGRRAEALEETAALAADAPGTVTALVADVTDPDSVDAAFAAIEADGGPAPALVHAAAAVEYCPARDLTPADFRKVVESVLFGAFDALHCWSKPLLESGSPGVAVFITSAIAAAGTPGASHSSAGKAGVEAMVKTIAREWGGDGIRLNVVGPGFVPVERTQAMWDDDAVSAPIREVIALGRPGTVAEIVGPIMFLLSEAATYVTGEVLVPDGGFRLTPHVVPRWKFDAEEGAGK